MKKPLRGGAFFTPFPNFAMWGLILLSGIFSIAGRVRAVALKQIAGAAEVEGAVAFVGLNVDGWLGLERHEVRI
jgi:hypothetical protein